MTARKLKIFLVMGSGAAPVPNSEIFKDNIYASLRSMGHFVHLIQFDKFLANICGGMKIFPVAMVVTAPEKKFLEWVKGPSTVLPT